MHPFPPAPPLRLTALLGLLALLLAFPPVPARASEIHEAVREGNSRRVLELLATRPELANFQSERDDRCSPLHLAVRRRHTDLVILLVEHGADVNLADKYGLSPMDLALGYGLDAIREFLAFHGARPLHRDEIASRPAPRVILPLAVSAPGRPSNAAIQPIAFRPGSGRRVQALNASAEDPPLANSAPATPASPGSPEPAEGPSPADTPVFVPGSRNLRAGTGGFLLQAADASAPAPTTSQPPSRDLEITDGSEAVVRGTPLMFSYDASADRTLDDLPPDERRPVAFDFVNDDDRPHRLAFSFLDERSRLILECDQTVTLPPPGPGFPTVQIREGTTIDLAEDPTAARFYVIVPPRAQLRILVDPTSVLPPSVASNSGAHADPDTHPAPGARPVPTATRTFVPNPFPFGGPALPLAPAPTPGPPP